MIVAAVVALVVVIYAFAISPTPLYVNGSTVKSEVTNMLKSQFSRPGEVRTSLKVVFSAGDTLNPKTIAADSGVIPASQICISKGEYANNSNLTLNVSSSNSILSYSNGPNLAVKLSVLCDTGSILRESLAGNGLPPEWMDASPQCQQVKASTQTGCIVAIRTA